jgi:hypothetical protein
MICPFKQLAFTPPSVLQYPAVVCVAKQLREHT